MAEGIEQPVPVRLLGRRAGGEMHHPPIVHLIARAVGQQNPVGDAQHQIVQRKIRATYRFGE